MDYTTREALRVILDAIEELTEYGELKVLGEWDANAQDMGLDERGRELEKALATVRENMGGN